MNYRQYSDDLCDDAELAVFTSNVNNDEISEIVIDITPESSDDSYLSLFDDSGSEIDDKDEFGISKDQLANKIKTGFQQVHVENVDPVAEKLQSFVNSGILPQESMFYILLKNAVSYVDWLVRRKENHCLQFQWDNEVLQFLESVEYHGGRKVVN